MRGVATGIVVATILHYLMNMHLSTRLIQLSWASLIKAWFPGIVLGAVSFVASWGIHVLTTILLWPVYWVLPVAIFLVPTFAAVTIFLFPNLLGPRSSNPLNYLPNRVKQFAVISNLLARLQ
jgi:hypothetical protein